MFAQARLWSVVSAAVALAGPALGMDQPQWTITSPNGKLAAILTLAPAAESGADPRRLAYRIEHGSERGRQEILPASPLGIVRGDEAWEEGLVFRNASRVLTIDETYRMPHGKRGACRSRACQQTFTFANARGALLEVIFRVADDGVAFRYSFPGPSDKTVQVTRELTGFHVPGDAQGWMSPYSEASQWTPAYEEYFQNVAAGTRSEKSAGWAFPALFRLAGGKYWVLLTDAAVDGSYCGCRLAQDAPQGVYRIRFPDAAEGWGQGEVEPRGKLPWATPWRVVMVADGLAGIVESTLVADLNPPSRVADVSWIKPGRAAWSWWSDHDSPRDYRKMTEFIDLAAELGWQYFLVDANWTLMDHGDVRQLARYAQGKGVGLWLWYNSGGEHNIVTEKPRGCMKAAEIRKFEFELLKKWGVAGVKIDFFHSDKQNLMGLYHDILRDAAAARIMVNFHGCTLPRGWSRTWPHLMSMEAVRGAECYTFAAEFPRHAPEHNTTLPFTRNVVGPMDYTPCALSDDKYPHLTTNAHELALCVVFESGVLHFADRVSAYRQLPEACKAYLRNVPVAWDEIRFLGGEPGQSVTLARRKGDQWYVGALNGRKEPLRLAVPLRFLGEGEFDAVVIGDGKEPRSCAIRTTAAKAADTIELPLLPYGGGVIWLKPR